MDIDLNLVDLTLARVTNGRLDERFQELLSEVQGINECAASYIQKNGTIESEITLKIKVKHTVAMGGDPAMTSLIAGGEITQRPKRLKSIQAAYTGKSGNLVVAENPPEQMAAFDGEGSGGVITPLASPLKSGGENGVR